MAYAQMRGLRVIRLGELAEALGFSDRQERSILSRLAVAGMIVRVRRGLYLIPPRLPLGGLWSPDDILALNVLMEDKRGAIPDLRTERLQPLWPGRAGSREAVCIQQPPVGRSHHRRGGDDSD